MGHVIFLRFLITKITLFEKKYVIMLITLISMYHLKPLVSLQVHLKLKCRCSNCFLYSLFTILLPKVVNFKHSMQIPALEVLPMRAINMHIFLCLETRKDFSQGDVFG